jgi:hypothetical protein
MWMDNDNDQLKKDVEARREELAGTIKELGNRIDVSRATFFAGIVTGILLLALLNRILFRRFRRRRRRCCC